MIEDQIQAWKRIRNEIGEILKLAQLDSDDHEWNTIGIIASNILIAQRINEHTQK